MSLTGTSNILKCSHILPYSLGGVGTDNFICSINNLLIHRTDVKQLAVCFSAASEYKRNSIAMNVGTSSSRTCES